MNSKEEKRQELIKKIGLLEDKIAECEEEINNANSDIQDLMLELDKLEGDESSDRKT